MPSLIVYPNDDIRLCRLDPTELTTPGKVLDVDSAAATFLARHYDFTFPSLRGPALLCALRDDGTITNFTTHEAVAMYRRVHTLANN